jgi:hypothetical protein
MGLYISLNKRRIEELDFNRFKSAFYIFDILLANLKKGNINILFYKDFPLQELNNDFKRVDFSLGILESSFRKKLLELKGDSISAGFEIQSEIIMEKKKFNLIFELLPRNRSGYYDIKIDIVPNVYAYNLEDLEEFSKELRMNIFNRIVIYNKESSKNSKHLFSIKRAVMSDHNKEFHNIDSWKFFYSKEPEEFINHISYGDRELKERLSFANRQKFAEIISNMNLFVYKLFEYAKESQVKVKEGSIAIIPKNQDSMKQFIGKMRNKISLVAKENYPNKKEFNDRLQKLFAN